MSRCACKTSRGRCRCPGKSVTTEIYAELENGNPHCFKSIGYREPAGLTARYCKLVATGPRRVFVDGWTRSYAQLADFAEKLLEAGFQVRISFCGNGSCSEVTPGGCR